MITSWEVLLAGGMVPLLNLWATFVKLFKLKDDWVRVAILLPGVVLTAVGYQQTGKSWGLGLIQGFVFSLAAMGIYGEIKKRVSP